SQEGGIYTCGSNWSGTLGLGDTSDRHDWTYVAGLAPVKSIAAGDAHSIALTATGQVWSAGLNWSGELGDGTQVNRSRFVFSNISNVRAVGSGPWSSHTLAIRMDGTVSGWGYN